MKVLILLLISFAVHAELSVMQKDSRLYVTDGTECVAWYMDRPVLSIPIEWMTVTEAAKNWPEATPQEQATCKSFIKIRVAKNSSYPTRPLKDLSGKKIGVVVIGTPCEKERIKSYSSTSIKWGHHYTTNKDGVRGIAVCATEGK